MALDIGTLVAYLELDSSKMESGFKGLTDKMPGWAGAAGVAAATATAAAFGAGLVNAINIDKAQDKVAAGLGLTEEESARAGDAAGALYADAYGESMEEVQTAVGGVISSIKGMRDASAAELEATTGKVMDLSGAFEIEAERISQVVGQMLTSGMAGSAEEGLDLLAASLQKVPVAVREDLLDAVDEYGPFFTQLGISGEEGFDMLVKASEKGMYGIDKTGDALKEFTIRSTDMSTTSVEAYEALGLSAEDMSAALLKGGEEGSKAFDTIVQGILGMEDPVAQSQAALALFGTPLEDLSVSEIPTFLESLTGMSGSLGEVDGAAALLGETLNGNVATTWTTISRGVEGLVTQFAGQLLPVVAEVVDWLAENPALVAAVVTGIGALSVGLGIAAAAQWAMNSAMLASPVTWIILGIVALGAAIVALALNWDAVVAWVSEVWGGFVTWLQEGLATLGADWDAMWAEVSRFFQETWTNITTWVVGVWEGFVSWLQESGDGIAEWWTGLWEGVGSFISDTWEGFTSGVSDIWEGFTSGITDGGEAFGSWWEDLWGSVGSFLSDTWDTMTGAASDAWTGLDTFLSRGLSDFMGQWGPFWENLGYAFESLWNGLKATVELIWGGIEAFMEGGIEGFGAYWAEQWGLMMAGAEDLWNQFKDGVVAIWDGFVSWFGGVIAAWSTFWSDTWTNITTGAQNIWQGFLDWLGGVPGSIMGFFAGIGAWLLGAGGDLFNGLYNGAVGAWNGLAGWLGGAYGRITGYFSGAWNWLLAAGRWVLDGLRNGIEGAWGNVSGWLGGMYGRITGFFGGAGSWLWNAGSWILNGFLDGLKSSWGAVTDFVGGIGDWIAANKGPEAYDKALLVRHGGWIMGGLGRGLEDGFGDVQDQVGAMGMGLEASFGSPNLAAALDQSVDFGGTSVSTPSLLRLADDAPWETQVSLDGARFIMEVDGREVVAVIREQIDESAEERKTGLVTRAGEVVFS